MKGNHSRMAGGSLLLGSLMLLFLSLVTNAQAPQQRSPLPLSPLSGGVLMAQALRSGKVTLPRLAPAKPGGASLKCGHAPCVFPNVQASGGGNPVNEDPIAANPAGKGKQLLTGGNDFNCFNVQGFYTTGNGGKTWLHHCMGNLPGNFGDGDPGVGYDANGTAYITGIDATPSGTGVIKYEKSTDNGATWSPTALAVTSIFSSGFTDKPWLEIDTSPPSPHVNNLYISLTDFDNLSPAISINVSHSSDGGVTFSTLVVDTVDFPTIDQFSDLAVGRDGTVYVTWMRCVANGPTGDCGGTTATLMFSKSTDGGATWSAPTTVASVALAPDTCGAFYGCLPNTFERVSEIPVIGVDTSTGPGAGNLYVVMYNWTGTFMQVLVSTSINGGSSWGPPVAVAPPTAIHDQFFPWLNVSDSGVVGVTWLDRRDDPLNISYEAFAALSTDNGATFGTNTKIASAMSNPFNDGFGGGFMGDYTGNAWFGNSLFASWMDTRSGTDSQDEVGGLSSSKK